MRVIECVVKDKPKHCAQCPLTTSQTRDCGRVIPVDADHGMYYDKLPNNKCHLREAGTGIPKKKAAKAKYWSSQKK